MIERFEDQGAFNGEIRLETRCARSRGGLRVAPRRDRLFVEPHGETATVDQCAIVRRPITDAITENMGGLGHTPIVAIRETRLNYATTSLRYSKSHDRNRL